MHASEASNAVVPEYLEALDGYMPWLALIVVFLALRSQIRSLIDIAIARFRAGSSMKVGLIEIGQAQRLITQTSDLEAELKSGKVKIEGNPDQMTLLMKAQGTVDGKTFSKSTKAMQLPGGCLVQVSTEVSTDSGDLSAAEALSFVPGVQILIEPDGSGGQLVSGTK